MQLLRYLKVPTAVVHYGIASAFFNLHLCVGISTVFSCDQLRLLQVIYHVDYTAEASMLKPATIKYSDFGS